MDRAEHRGVGAGTPDPALLERAFREAAANADVVITSGGVSVGEYDLVAGVLAECGVETLAWHLNIRPGMPLLIGRKAGTAVFGLPGNPVSAMVTYAQFVRPAIRRLRGSAAQPLRIRALLEEEIVKQDDKRHYVRGVLGMRGEATTVRSTGSQVSNVLSSLVRANCLIILPEAGKVFPAGTSVEVELL